MRPSGPVRFDLGSSENLHLALAPLSEVSRAIAAELIAHGNGDKCGDCGKRFTSARKWQGVIRYVTVSSSGLAASCYLVCRRCKNAAEQRRAAGASVATEYWRDEARAIHKAGGLMQQRSRGTA